MNEQLIGKRIAQRYDLLAMIGRGGMGAVYKARDLKAERDVALKIIRPEYSTDPKTRRRFNKEARAFAFLKHPNIVEVHDFGQDEADNTLYLSMELVQGLSLRILKRLELPLSAIVTIVDQLLGALAHAHARGVIHRDLKPENVLVTQPGLPDDTSPVVKLVDFGLAALPTQSGLSQTGTLLGTPAYMAPEQARGSKGVVGPGTDIYAVGVLLYEMLCGHLPYLADGGVETLLKHVQEPIPDLDPRPDLTLPDGFDDVVRRALAKKPWDRFINAAEFRRAFSRIEVPEEPMPALELEDASDDSGKTHSHPTHVSSTHGRLQTPIGHRSSAALQQPTPPRGTNPAIVAQSARPDTPPPRPRSSVSHEAIQAASAQSETIPTPPSASSISALNPGYTRAVPLVGRSHEMLRLEEACERALQGQGQIVIIEGEAGIGKSRLARAVMTRFTETGLMREAIGLYSPTESSGPNVGLRGALEGIFGTADMDRSAMQAQTQGVLQRIGIQDDHEQSELVNVLRPPLPSATPQPQATGLLGNEALLRRQRTQIALIQRTIRLIGQEMPLIFILEDIHWSNDNVGAFLESMANSFRLHATPCVLVVSLVHDELDTLGTLGESIGRLSRFEGSIVHRIQLERLEPDDAVQLIQDTLPLEPELARQIAERSGGNPLYAIQFLQSLQQDKGLTYDPEAELWRLAEGLKLEHALPTSVAEVLKRRIQRTRATIGEHSETCYQFLIRVAILGLSVDVQLLEAFLHLEGDATLLKNLDHAIEVWLDNSILREAELDRHSDVIEFDHPLIRDVLLEGLPNRKLRRLHGHAAQAKRDFFYPYLQAVAADIAEHHRQAGDLAQTCEYLLLAARSAEAAGAFPEAAKHYAALLSFRRNASDSTEFILTPNASTRISSSSGLHRVPETVNIDWSEVWLGLGRIAVAQGDYDQAKAYVEELVQYAIERDLLLPQAKANWLLGRVANRRGQLVDAWDHFGMARDLYEAETDMVGTAQCLWGLGQVARASGWLTDARKFIHEASAIYEESDRPVDVASCMLALGWVDLAGGQLAPAREQFERAQATFEAAQDTYNTHYCLLGIAHIERLAGNVPESLRLLELARDAFAELGDRHGHIDCIQGIGQCYMLLGQLDEAESHFEEALAGYQQLDDSQGQGRNLLNQARMLRLRDAKTQAIQFLSQAQDHFLTSGDRRGQSACYLTLARIALDLGDLERAEGHFNQAHELYTISEDAIGIAECAEVWARIVAQRDDASEALNACNDGLEIAERTGARPLVAAILVAAMEIIAQSGKLAELRSVTERFDALDIDPLILAEPAFFDSLRATHTILSAPGIDPYLRGLRDRLAEMIARVERRAS